MSSARDRRWSEKSEPIERARVARLHFRKARSARYRVTKSACSNRWLRRPMNRAAARHQARIRAAGRRVGKQNRGRFRQRHNILINNVFSVPQQSERASDSWRKCHKKAKNVGVLVDSNLPSRRNAYKQNQNSHRGISAYIMAWARPSGAERQIRSREFGD